MGLRQQAEADLAFIIEDETNGFGWPITLTDPSGLVRSFTGLSDDIAQAIDPDTGTAVSGRFASVALRVSSILAAGMTYPQGVADTGSKPWLVQFDDINGTAYTFKVSQSDPDRALGLVVCLLEAYK